MPIALEGDVGNAVDALAVPAAEVVRLSGRGGRGTRFSRPTRRRPNGQSAAYLAKYAKLRLSAPYLASFAYWAVAAMIDGAAFRVRGRPESVAVPLDRLRALLDELDRGRSPQEAMYRS